MKPCSFMCGYKYGILIFLLNFKAAFTKLVHIHVHKFLCFFASVKFQMLLQKYNFTYKIFSTSFHEFGKRLMSIYRLIRAKKASYVIAAIIEGSVNRFQKYLKPIITFVTLPGQTLVLRFFWRLRQIFIKINSFVFLRSL